MSEIIGCYSRGIPRFEEDSTQGPGHEGEARVYKVDFNRGLVTIMRSPMESGAHYPAKLELIIMFHGELR